MIDLKPLLSHFNLDAIYGVDAETYWASDYSLSDKKRGTTDYIIDDRFELQLMSVRKDSWAKPKVMERDEFIRWARTINWARTGFLAHHAHFDGLIASHHCGGVRPAMYFDTLSMARPLMPISVGGSLKAVCAAFAREAKVRFSATVRLGKMPRPSGTIARPARDRAEARADVTSAPFNCTLPEAGRNRPASVRSNVVFPMPLRPSRLTVSPGATAKETPRRI